MEDKAYFLKNEIFYNRFYHKYGKTWGTTYSQEIRFAQFLKVDITSEDTILDIGCGQGELKDYLEFHAQNYNYTGIDVREPCIKLCKDKHPDSANDFRLVNFFDIDNTQYDWVFASGLFSLNRDDYHWYQMVQYGIMKMMQISKKGIVINFLYCNVKTTGQHDTHCVTLAELGCILDNSHWAFTLHTGYVDDDITLTIKK